MPEKLHSVLLRDLNTNTNISLDLIENGPKRPAIQLIKLFSHTEWEEFILEWATSCLINKEYYSVERCSGAGDKGRDIVAYLEESNDNCPFDNYQCKHYNHPLRPSDIWLELGKLCYYTFNNAYPVPRKYFFVAPCGIGTKLAQLLKKPKEFNSELIKVWSEKCETNITNTQDVVLEGDLLKYVEDFDFSILNGLNIFSVIEEHSKTRWHPARFGGGLPQRPNSDPVPAEIEDTETNYVSQLLKAYSEKEKSSIEHSVDLEKYPQLKTHFNRSRIEFYSAEALRSFTRDNLQPGEYDKLQDDFFHGVIDTVNMSYSHGYDRVLKTCQQARSLIISHPIHSRMNQMDRGGICHQLVNNERMKWAEDA